MSPWGSNEVMSKYSQSGYEPRRSSETSRVHDVYTTAIEDTWEFVRESTQTHTHTNYPTIQSGSFRTSNQKSYMNHPRNRGIFSHRSYLDECSILRLTITNVNIFQLEEVKTNFETETVIDMIKPKKPLEWCIHAVRTNSCMVHVTKISLCGYRVWWWIRGGLNDMHGVWVLWKEYMPERGPAIMALKPGVVQERKSGAQQPAYYYLPPNWLAIPWFDPLISKEVIVQPKFNLDSCSFHLPDTDTCGFRCDLFWISAQRF